MSAKPQYMQREAAARGSGHTFAKGCDRLPQVGITEDPWPFHLLLKACGKCLRNVSWKNSVLRWAIPRNRLRYCYKLWKQLQTGKYKLSKYRRFYVTEPKRRMVLAPHIRDRIVQRLMCDNGVYADLMKSAIWDNTACQTGKGTTKAIDRLKCHMQRYWRKHGTTGWVLRLDIHHFFESIPHTRLKDMVHSKIHNPIYARMLCRIIDSYPGDHGLGLGAQTSQLLAISYLSPLDHAIKERFHIKYYLRYSDDLVFIHNDRQVLLAVWRFVYEWLKRMGLTLNDKSTLHPLCHGVMFMKWRFSLTGGGKVIMCKRKACVHRYVRHVRRCIRSGIYSIDDMAVSLCSWTAHMALGHAHRIIGNVRYKVHQWLTESSLRKKPQEIGLDV